MAKRKNHTAHNQAKKIHRNGIRKPVSHKYRSLRGMDPKFLRNMKFAKANNKSSLQNSKLRGGSKDAPMKDAKPAAKPAAAAAKK